MFQELSGEVFVRLPIVKCTWAQVSFEFQTLTFIEPIIIIVQFWSLGNWRCTDDVMPDEYLKSQCHIVCVAGVCLRTFHFNCYSNQEGISETSYFPFCSVKLEKTGSRVLWHYHRELVVIHRDRVPKWKGIVFKSVGCIGVEWNNFSFDSCDAPANVFPVNVIL